VQNYRGLKDVSFSLSHFTCIIGENNSGKSSLLQALSLFHSGSTLGEHNYFDPEKEISIAVKLEGIGQQDLARLADAHRERIAAICRDGSLTLVRRYEPDGKSRLRYVAQRPKEERFRDESVSNLMQGQRAGRPFMAKVIEVFPELDGQMEASTNQTDARALVNSLAETVPADQMEPVELDLPTGLDKSVDALLPRPIYIQAVKDLADETKAREGTPFAKVLALLLRAIEGKLNDEKQLFEQLNAKLNRIEGQDGVYVDERLAEVRLVEETVQQHLRESFSNVDLCLRIPPPQIKAILAGAQIFVDDGVEGIVETKGDGLRRAIVFAIMRTYVDLNARGLLDTEGNGVPPDPYLLLFEEPELYLHPKAQQILFAALRTLSAHHHVVVTTHSPIFCGPEAASTFVRLSKQVSCPANGRPFALARYVDLSDMSARDQFQLICFENNNAALFSDTIVLVEGDSDYIVLPHIARTLSLQWDCRRVPVSFVRVHGKGSIRRYRDFLDRFGVRVIVVSDLDLLISGLAAVDDATETQRKQSALLQEVDRVCDARGLTPTPTGKEIADAQSSGALRSQWDTIVSLSGRVLAKTAEFDELAAAIEEWLSWVKRDVRLEVLRNADDANVKRIKQELLADLRARDIFVLERGAIDAYYPEGITGEGKPARAQCFCHTVTSRDDLLALCGETPVDGGAQQKEFEMICQRIFAPI
jgi:predicted ATPase